MFWARNPPPAIRGSTVGLTDRAIDPVILSDRLALAFAVAGAGLAAWAYYRQREADNANAGRGGVKTYAYRPYGSQAKPVPLPPAKTATPLAPMETGTPDYQAMARQAAQAHGVPPGLFVRLIDRESGFQPDAVGPTGDLGIAQLNPRFHPRDVALDPRRALDYAANYLRSLYDQFGTWQQAVAAYNWGPTNLARFGMSNIPDATRQYVYDIVGG